MHGQLAFTAPAAQKDAMKIARFAPLGLLAVATAISAQTFYTPQSGAPSNNPALAPGPTGQPGGESGTTATSSTLSGGDWQADAARKMDGRTRQTASRKDAAHPAKPSDLTKGATIADAKGVEVGYIKSIDSDGVVVATASGQVKVPADAFGKNSKGLLIGMSKADFDKLVTQAVGG